MTVPRCGGEGQADGAVLGCFDVEEQGAGVEEEQGADVEAHIEDAEEGAQWR
jgi:hypothetical protein